jgi:hypothetical protein
MVVEKRWHNRNMDRAVGLLGLLALLGSCSFNRNGLPLLSGADSGSSEAGALELGPLAEQGADRDGGVSPGGEKIIRTDLAACPTTCKIGCVSGTVTCRRVPSNTGSVDLTKLASCGSPTLTTLSTTDCKVGTCTGVLDATAKLCVIKFDSLVISSTVRVDGTNGVVIVADGNVTIGAGGTLDSTGTKTGPGAGGGGGGVPANEVTPTPGQCPTGQPSCTGGGGVGSGCTSDDNGGGGGGYGQAGGAGGQDTAGSTCTTKPTGGAAYGNDTLVPLLGGTGGASGQNATAGDPAPAAGGSGGGAIQITTQGVLRIDGVINVGGGGGRGGNASATAGCGNAGGGGGSGGAVLLEAASIEGSGWVTANGGGGGGGAVKPSIAGDGEPGQPSSTPAKGGLGGGTGGAGGDGGTGLASPPKDGVTATEGGGGGGGGAGRIRLNTQSLAPTLHLSGFWTQGQLTL